MVDWDGFEPPCSFESWFTANRLQPLGHQSNGVSDPSRTGVYWVATNRKSHSTTETELFRCYGSIADQ